MNSKIAALVPGLVLLLTAGWAQATSVRPAPVRIVAQANSDWQPVARIDRPQFPILVELINNTGIPLEYGFTNASPDQVPSQALPPNGSTTLTLTDPEVQIAVHTSVSAAQDTDVSLRFQAQVTSNNSVQFVIMRAGQAPPDAAAGDVINIQRSGGIFIY